MDTFDVGDTATLSATFYVDDDPTDPATVTLRVKDTDGTITTPTPTSLVEGTWEYEFPLTTPGIVRWEFKGVGNADGVQGGALRVRVSLLDADSPATFVTPDDVETALGREMTPDEYERADQFVTQLVTLMERSLRRDLVARAYLRERHVIPGLGEPLLWHAPVASVDAITYGSTSVSFDAEDPWLGLLPGGIVYIDYTTDPELAGPLDDIRAVIVDAIARTILMGPTVASGAIKSYTVEGTSITYGGAGAGGADGRFTVGDMKGIQGARKPLYLEVGGRGRSLGLGRDL